MALFCINRYSGEEEQEPEAPDRARVLLERLQQQARARQLRKQKEAQAEGGEGELCPGGAGLSPGGEAGRGKRKSESEEQPCAAGQTQVKKKRPRGPSEDRAGSEGSADGSTPSKKKKENRRKSKVLQERPESDSEADIKQHENRSNFKSKSSKKTKRDEETEGVETREEENSEGAEGNQSPKEELSLAASEEEAKPPPSSLMVLGDYDRKPVQKVQPFLPHWLAQPKLVQKCIKDNLFPIGDIPGLHPRLLKKLQVNGIESFFPVQAEVIPAILQSASNGYLLGQGGYRPRDICVSAPTGSGKTLAFVIPIVQVLLDRVVCQVRALVVLPTKELAQQVSKVFNIYTDGTGLKVVLITGQKSFAKEQEMLVQKKVTSYCSLADIIVATPGRLTDHINQTPGFNLTQLRFLIIDEADRMIDDMHQNCLNQIVKAAFRVENDSGSNMLFQRTKPGPITAASSCYPQIPLQKLLFSATLTQDPEKLQQLDLFQPRLFTSVYSEKKTLGDGTETDENTNKKYTLPEGLSQCYVPCDLNSKPLLLLHFMLTMKFTRVLCFTNSREASHRLFLLVRAFGGVPVAEFSSLLPPNERQRTIKEFEQGKIQLLISTDATARGIDVKAVNYVINYDAPQFIRTYIHRVGRTARAGKAGVAFSLVLRIQERRFLRMLKDAGIQDIKKHPVKGNSLKPLVQRYEEALCSLQKTVKNERAQKRA
ncbi:ATP-dependent RNA helicase DDX51 [Pezoporus wallicus]|uniref:ATP-dependent RNA helicase DDX51 n=1 Tax=Pezoporus wallicus TaxID=35540 RepID=UPI00254FCFE6|nr:ATP-dependent RNA helicase DDX51 [Pezoporus wallicus]XP_061321980.1 ATP-dependent RNA helicase DDX51 [Pezoporus flaviventris]